MSLLEDVFLEDETGEAQELERIIEGDEFEQRPRSRSDNENDIENDDEAVEDKRRVDPNSNKSRRVIKNPRFTLNPARLTGPRGIQVIPDHFKDFKFKGKGHEKEDLDLVLKKLEHWAYRLYPRYKFEDCLKKIETLGKKSGVIVHLRKIRSGQYISEETVVQEDSSGEEAEKPPEDEFDKLLQQQIELASSTPAPGSIKKNMNSTNKEHSSTAMPKATSSPSISEEQKERMIRNRKLAEERRAKLKSSKIENLENDNESVQQDTINETVAENEGIVHDENVLENDGMENNSITEVLSNDNESQTPVLISNDNDDKIDKVDDMTDSNDLENEEVNKESNDAILTKQSGQVEEAHIELMDVDFSEDF